MGGILKKGTAVFVHGLNGARQYNGKRGSIVSFKDGRMVVQIDGGASMALLSTKLIVPDKTRVILHGLSRDKFNGSKATVVNYDRAADRYLVETSRKEKIKVKRINFKL